MRLSKRCTAIYATLALWVCAIVVVLAGNLTVDMWQDFDFTGTIDAATLEAHDHYATTPAWTVSNASSLLSMSTSGERLLQGTINTLSDSGGTNGIAYNCNVSVNPGYVDFTIPGTQHVVSFGFWFQFPAAFVGTFTEHDIFVIPTTLGTRQYYVKLGDANQGFIRLFNQIDSYSAAINLSAATWYWITGLYDDGNAASGMKVRVYDTSGVLVGAEKTRTTAADLGAIDAQIGSLIGASGGTTLFAGNLYWDDLLVDYTNHVYPLGPGTASGGPCTRTLLGVGC